MSSWYLNLNISIYTIQHSHLLTDSNFHLTQTWRNLAVSFQCKISLKYDKNKWQSFTEHLKRSILIKIEIFYPIIITYTTTMAPHWYIEQLLPIILSSSLYSYWLHFSMTIDNCSKYTTFVLQVNIVYDIWCM